MNIHIICRNWEADRVLPRFARYLVDGLGWTVSAQADKTAQANYLMGYFEDTPLKGFAATPLVAYMTHREENAQDKAGLYDAVAQRVNLRIAMNAQQLTHLTAYGETVVLPLPVETDRFIIAERPTRARPLVGIAGYTYKTGRKGEDLLTRLLVSAPPCDFTASGRGWPVTTKMYTWQQMPGFYQSLDVFLCTSTVEGGPMTTLEALATGCPVVIPDSVGIHPQLPDIPGIYRYTTGDYDGMHAALTQALAEVGTPDRRALRAAVGEHTVKNWVAGNRQAFEHLLGDCPETPADDWRGKAGIYVVAFGDPARAQARTCITSARKWMPDIPVALCSDKPLGPETILITQKDADIGGRIAKLKAYDLAPRDWQYVLYVDADTEFVADVSFLFQLVADGWEFVICKDAHLHDTAQALARGNNATEYADTVTKLGTHDALAINGGVWAFRRNARTQAFFKRWLDEWSIYKGRDQSALIRALYAAPLKVYWLGNEWNTLITIKGEEYPPGIKGSAGILHHVGLARRWEGQVPAGKGLTDPEAWAMVEAYKAEHGKVKK